MSAPCTVVPVVVAALSLLLGEPVPVASEGDDVVVAAPALDPLRLFDAAVAAGAAAAGGGLPTEDGVLAGRDGVDWVDGAKVRERA